MTGPNQDGALDRRRLREMFAPQTRYVSSKIMPLDDAIRAHVKPGMTIHFGYTGARPMAASNALVRVFAGTKPGFWVVCAGMVANQASLVSEGLLRKMTVSFVGENYPDRFAAPRLSASDRCQGGRDREPVAAADRAAACRWGFRLPLRPHAGAGRKLDGRKSGL